MPKCKHKHTEFNPKDEAWKCPNCGADNGYFYKDDSPDFDCEELHVEDCVRCESCASNWSGKKVAALMMKKANQKPCPHCKGTGVIDA